MEMKAAHFQINQPLTDSAFGCLVTDLRESEMQRHNWLIEVCQDLKDYAMHNDLEHLEDQLQRAIGAAKHDLLLAALDISQERTSNVIVLEPSIAVYHEQERV
ncbi:hypothetical protein [Tateyamaria sp. SN3-11]|uniref:hypothetical protein n=1 Tax=Tateyamaria sp. SN3-11 TaxID=3092147 RepID=UPI0039E9D435